MARNGKIARNIQHSTPKVEGWREAKRLEGSKLGVEC
jgi:hypothetical protein